MIPFRPFSFVFLTLLAMSCISQQGAKENGPIEPEITTQAEPEVLPSADSLVIHYERTPCYGSCPHFELDIYQSGYAQYNGKNFVNLVGLYACNIEPSTISAFLGEASAVGFYQMEESYDDSLVMDLPSMYLTIKKDDRELKTVINKFRGPKELSILYAILDHWIEECDWIPLNLNEN